MSAELVDYHLLCQEAYRIDFPDSRGFAAGNEIRCQPRWRCSRDLSHALDMRFRLERCLGCHWSKYAETLDAALGRIHVRIYGGSSPATRLNIIVTTRLPIAAGTHGQMPLPYSANVASRRESNSLLSRLLSLRRLPRNSFRVSSRSMASKLASKATTSSCLYRSNLVRALTNRRKI